MGQEQYYLYSQLVGTLIEHINNGTYKKGSKFPSRRELCYVYDVSRTTIHRALKELSLRGYVKSIQGKSVFVSKPTIKQ